MKLNKLQFQDFQILYITEGCYRVAIRRKVLWFFYKWDTITYQEAENSEEKPLEFKTFKEANEFIESIVR